MDRDIVKTHLMIIRTWASVALENNSNFFTSAHFRDIARWMDDTLELLKEQEDEIKELRSIVEFWKNKALHT